MSHHYIPLRTVAGPACCLISNAEGLTFWLPLCPFPPGSCGDQQLPALLLKTLSLFDISKLSLSYLLGSAWKAFYL